MKWLIKLVVAIAIIAGGPLLASAKKDTVGIVKSVNGEAVIVRQAGTMKAEVNTPLKLGDVIKTGPTGSIGLILEDDTVVSMGPSGEIAIDDFVFDPAEAQLSMVVRMIRGSFSFLSGQIAKLAPENVRLETPDATIGMRGTRLLVNVE
jgi:hypothetical protein